MRKQQDAREMIVRRRSSSIAREQRDARVPGKLSARIQIEGPDVDDDRDPDEEELLYDELTAQPSRFDSDAVTPVPETGLSVDPEDLGRQALVEATQQDNFESLHEDANLGIHVINPHLVELPD
jgi:hypothetical protein